MSHDIVQSHRELINDRDADYICNVQGGEAVSLNINYTHSEQFAAAGYEKFMVDGEEFGEVRQYGNCKSNRSI